MIFAAIADVHGNYAALEAVLADIKKLGITDIVNLGDCFSGPLDAGRTADILIGEGIPSVRGNHDRALVEQSFEEMGPWEKTIYPQLSASHLDWLKALPVDMVFKDVAYCCHGSPKGDLDYWLERLLPEGLLYLRPLAEIEAIAQGISQPLMLCGHTHIARTVQLSDGRLIVNPGSVGCPGWKDDDPFYHQVEAGHPLAMPFWKRPAVAGRSPIVRCGMTIERWWSLPAKTACLALGMPSHTAGWTDLPQPLLDITTQE